MGPPAPLPATAVIVTYQSARTLAAALAGARRCHRAGLLDCLVVDNGSSDATLEIAQREAAGWARVQPTGRNAGFGRGCNAGLEQVTSRHTLFLNPDAVVEPEGVATLVRFLDEHPQAGLVGPAIVEGEPGREPVLQVTGPRPTPGRLLRAALPLLRRPPASFPIVPGAGPARTGWVCGAVLMGRTELLRSLGGFDPRFFLYWEETDLCKRVEEAGYQIWALGTAVARHVGGASSAPDDTRIGGCIGRHYYQSRFYYLVKHHGWPAAAAAEAGEFGLLGLRALADLARGRGTALLRPRLQARLFSQPEIPGR